jgi:hypothetical protein
VILAAAILLERWPSSYGAPRFSNALDLGGGATAFVSGASVEGDFARVPAGDVDLLVRSRADLAGVTLIAEGEGRLALPDRAPVALSARGTRFELPLLPLVTLTGRRGVQETLYRQRVEIEGPAGAVLRFAAGAR